MTPAARGWKQVGQRVAERMAELETSVGELERQSGVSQRTIRKVLAGEELTRADKRRAIATTLGWTPNSLSRIADGFEPVVLPTTDEAEAELELVEDDLAGVLRAVREQLERVEAKLSERD